MPDLVATKSDDKLIVEVKLKDDPRNLERYRKVIDIVKSNPGWRFLIQTVSENWQPERTPTKASLDIASIHSYFSKTSKILATGVPELAIPYLWNAIIGLLRVNASRDGVEYEGITDRSLINRIYSSGLISKSDHERLLNWNHLRNEVVHNTNPQVDSQTAHEVAQYAQKLLNGLES